MLKRWHYSRRLVAPASRTRGRSVPARAAGGGLLALDLVQSLAFAGLVLFGGYGIKRVVPPLTRYNVPAPVVGGLLVALAISVSRLAGVTLVTLDTTLQTPLMIAFFTSVGFGASVSLLREGGPLVLIFFVISSLAAIAQNVIGIVSALALGQHPLMGVLAGSVTLTGGPATGLAFAPLFEAAGVPAAGTLAVAAAMVGIVSGGIIGGPIGTWLIGRYRLSTPRGMAHAVPHVTASSLVEDRMSEPEPVVPAGEDRESYALLKTMVVMLVAMWIGGLVSVSLNAWLARISMALPAYIGAMLVAAAIRNGDEAFHLIGISQRLVDDLGNVALSLFLVLALTTLKLWEIVHIAVPLTIIVLIQVVLVAALCVWPIFRLMGRDYQAAVISSGFCGFMLGTTANAMANMEALVERYGPAPRALLVVPMVGAFFIDSPNALIITAFVNVFR
jgi:glutamate:Na+ symporter, ESS family